jgi:hypothetical protein
MSIFRSKLSAAAPLSVLALLAVSAHGQLTLGTVSGTVTDSTGASVSGAQITITNNATSLTFSAQTKDNGSYAFQNLPIGSYTVTVVKDGFDQQQYPNIQVQENRTISLNAQLKTGKVSESVTVTATPLLNATDTTNGYVLDNSQIQQTPLATGSFTQLAILAPGVNAEFINGTGTNEGLGNQPIWANGQRDTDNSFMVNGVEVSNLFNGKSTSQVASGRVVPSTGENFVDGGTIQTNTSVYDAIGNAIPTPSPESIGEMRVNASMYDAQQGQKSGAHIDVSTLSGTNQYHGQGYVNRQTNFLNAAPFFYKQQSAAYGGPIAENEVNPYIHRVVGGGTLGGPIIKDKLFGFISYNAIRITDLLNGRSPLYLPSGLTDDRSVAGITSAVASTNQTFNGTIDPAALKVLQFKLPNGQYLIPSAGPNAAANLNNFQPTNDLFGVPSFKADQANGNIDFNATKADVLSLKYFYQHDPAENPFTDSNVSGFNQHLDAGGQLASIVNTWTPSSRLSWVQSFGFVREKGYSYNDQALSPQDVGINLFGFTTFPGLNISKVNGITNNGLKVGPTGSFFRDGFFQNRFQPSTTVIATLGNHTLSAGASYSYTQLNIANRRQNTGIISFNNFANFVEGAVKTGGSSTFLQGASNRYYRTNDVGGFAQDKWQIRPNISITAGVRYDYNGPLTEKYGNLFNFDPKLYQYDAASDTIVNDGFVIAGNNKLYHTPGVSASTLTERQWGVSPRIGVAWSPMQNQGRIVFRAGGGLYYNRGEYFTYLSPGAGSGVSGPFGVTQEPPFVIPTQAPKGATLSNPFGTTLPNPPTGNPQDFYNYLPNIAGLQNGDQTYPFGAYDSSNKLPYTENWSLDMQWQVNATTSVTIGYVGNRGRHGVIPIPFNQPGIATPQNPINGEIYSYGYQATDTNGNNLTTEPDNTYDGGNTDIRVPYIGYSVNSVTYKANGNSAYDALGAQLQKRFSNGLQFNVSYTFSHSLDEQSGLGLFYNGNNPLNLRTGYGSSDFDRTHDVTFNYVYMLPDFIKSHNWLSRITNGFGIQGITVFQSGQPYSVEDYSGAIASQYYSYNDGITNPIIPLAAGYSPHQALTGHSGAFVDGSGNAIPALNANAFTIPFISPGVNGVPACGVSTAGAPVCDVFETGFGPGGQRNIFRQPFQKRADLSIVKTAKINERASLKYTFDIYNVSNTPSFDIPNNSISTGYNTNNQLAYNPALSTIANQQTVYNIQNNGVNVSAASGLGVVQQTIGSPRLIQMSLHILF